MMPGRQRQAVGLHRLVGCAELAADGGDLPGGHPEVAVHGRAASPVVDFGVLDDQVEHFGSSGFASWCRRGNIFQFLWR